MTGVVVAVLVTGLFLGYHWSRDHIRLTREITRLGGGK